MCTTHQHRFLYMNSCMTCVMNCVYNWIKTIEKTIKIIEESINFIRLNVMGDLTFNLEESQSDLTLPIIYDKNIIIKILKNDVSPNLKLWTSCVLSSNNIITTRCYHYDYHNK